MNKLCQLPECFGILHASATDERDPKIQHSDAHVLLDALLLRHLPDRVKLSAGVYGKPFLADMPQYHFNLSHCSRLAVCLLSDVECGVDAEVIRKLRPAVVRRCFSKEEQMALEHAPDPDRFFTRLWTLKEAYVKAIGIGISYPMQDVSFRLEEDSIHSNRTDAAFAQILLPEHVISVCVQKSVEVQPVLTAEWNG